MLLTLYFPSPAVAPPLNIQATQASASAPVEVSWSPPSGGAATITGYRIFYGNGENMFVNARTLSITISGQVGEMISVRSESAHIQLPSELITVTVTVTCEFYYHRMS